MTFKRLYQSLRLWTIHGDAARANWARKHNIYGRLGDHVSIMDRKVPLYAKLIHFHNNIHVASAVQFIVHDVARTVLNGCPQYGGGEIFQEHINCIEVLDNVSIGSGSIILGDVRIGPNAVIAGGSLVNRHVPPNSVIGGVPAKVISRFDDFSAKRAQKTYPDEMCPRKQGVSDELARFIWNRFYQERS